MVALQARDIEWQPLRTAFIERPLRPTYAELSAEFGVKESTIGRCAGDEGWSRLRAAWLERQLVAADANSILLQAVKVDRTIVHDLADYAIVSIRRIKLAVEGVPELRAASTKLEAYNTANFAVRNLCAALKDAGIVGLPKGLADAGKEDNGRWNPQLLSQINVTVQNLANGAAKAEAEAKPAPEEPPTFEASNDK